MMMNIFNLLTILTITMMFRVWLVNTGFPSENPGRDGRWLWPIPLDGHDFHHVKKSYKDDEASKMGMEIMAMGIM